MRGIDGMEFRVFVDWQFGSSDMEKDGSWEMGAIISIVVGRKGEGRREIDGMVFHGLVVSSPRRFGSAGMGRDGRYT